MAEFPSHKSIVITGGIGDFFAIESFLSDSQRNTIEDVYYGTRAHKQIRLLFSSLPNYPKLKRHVVIIEDFSNRGCFSHRHDMNLEFFTRNNQDIERLRRWNIMTNHIADFSIADFFPNCSHGYRAYNNSSFLIHKLTDISRFILPENYIAICPYTVDDRRDSNRDFSKKDWDFVKDFLAKKKCFGVVLNIGNDPVPEHPLIVNMSNQTNLLESVEILKKANGYVGIDSALSVLAVKIFKPPMLIVKSNNNHLFRWAKVYYAPNNSIPFVVSGLREI
jgi:hypothetical protein